MDDFGTILSPAFRAATVFVGIAVIISILCIISFILFFMCRYIRVVDWNTKVTSLCKVNVELDEVMPAFYYITKTIPSINHVSRALVWQDVRIIFAPE